VGVPRADPLHRHGGDAVRNDSPESRRSPRRARWHVMARARHGESSCPDISGFFRASHPSPEEIVAKHRDLGPHDGEVCRSRPATQTDRRISLAKLLGMADGDVTRGAVGARRRFRIDGDSPGSDGVPTGLYQSQGAATRSSARNRAGSLPPERWPPWRPIGVGGVGAVRAWKGRENRSLAGLDRHKVARDALLRGPEQGTSHSGSLAGRILTKR
jgi:hypothetical protein